MTKNAVPAEHKARRPRKPAKAPAPLSPTLSEPTTKLDRLAALLAQPGGATIAEMMSATNWQAHSVRGALAGSLKRRGIVVTSNKVDGLRRYRSGASK